MTDHRRVLSRYLRMFGLARMRFRRHHHYPLRAVLAQRLRKRLTPREQHRMGPDVPHWVQDQLDAAYAVLTALWAVAWRCAVLGTIVAALWWPWAIANAAAIPRWGSIILCWILYSVQAVAVGVCIGRVFARDK